MATGEQEQIETERKYDVDTGFVLPDLAGAGSASVSPAGVQLRWKPPTSTPTTCG